MRFGFLPLFFACGGGGSGGGGGTPGPTAPPSPVVTTITVSLSAGSVPVSRTITASATATDQFGASINPGIVEWSTASAGIATVGPTGIVAGVAVGQTQVIASASGKQGQASVTVSPVPVASITVTPSGVSVIVGNTQQLNVTLKDAAGNALTDRLVNWSSNNAVAATVSSSGLVTGLSAGTAIISASSEGVSGTATITVSLLPVSSVTTTLGSSAIFVGGTTQATATLKDATGGNLVGRAVTWASSNALIASVSSTGLVTGLAVGSSTIAATSEGVAGSTTVTVSSAPVASVVVTFASSTVASGSSTQAIATLKDPNGNILTGRAVSWSSGNSNIATVNSAGLVSAVAPGSVSITATSETKTGSSALAVVPPFVFGSSTEKIKVVDVGSAFSPTLTGTTTSNLTFVSRATSVANVDTQGKITAVGSGQVWVVATGLASADSVYLIIPVSSSGPVFRSDLTSFNVAAGATTVVNIILDTRATPIGGAEMLLGFTTSPTVFASVSGAVTGTPVPIATNLQTGVVRLSLASGSALTGQLSVFRFTFTTVNAKTSGFLTLTLLDLVSPTGTDLLPTSTSTRIPILVQ